MLIYQQQAGPPDCRLAVVPPCEFDTDPAQNAPILALACFQMRMRDTIDFRVDFSKWLAANGNPTITAATFAAAAESPSDPSISGQAFTPSGMCVVVLNAPDGSKPGDAYHLDITVTVGATIPVSPTDVAIPSRTLVRRIHVVVVNG
jgi:hypothetical protein